MRIQNICDKKTGLFIILKYFVVIIRTILDILTRCDRLWMQDAMAFVRPPSFYLLHFQPVHTSPLLIYDHMLQIGLNFTFCPLQIFILKQKVFTCIRSRTIDKYPFFAATCNGELFPLSQTSKSLNVLRSCSRTQIKEILIASNYEILIKFYFLILPQYSSQESHTLITFW